jgi:hypothetical protein
MAKGSIIARDRDTLAAPDDIQRILGTLDETKLLDIMALRPTILLSRKHPCGLLGIPTSLAPASRSDRRLATSLQS